MVRLLAINPNKQAELHCFCFIRTLFVRTLRLRFAETCQFKKIILRTSSGKNVQTGLKEREKSIKIINVKNNNRKSFKIIKQNFYLVIHDHYMCFKTIRSCVPCIPLISRVRGPYGDLWTEFSLPFMAQARSTRAMKTRKEKTRIHNLLYGTGKRG